MPKISYSIWINQPPNIIEKAFLNPDNVIYWTSDLEKYEIIKDTGGKAGAVAHLHYLEKGKRYVMEDVLDYIESGKLYRSHVSGQGMMTKIETRLKAKGDGTEVSVIWVGRHNNLLVRIIMSLLKKKITTRAMKDFQKFKKLIEEWGWEFKGTV